MGINLKPLPPAALICPRGVQPCPLVGKSSPPPGSQTQRCMSEPPRRHAPTDIPTHPPPTLCLCSEPEWLVFHFGLPGALLHSLAWPVYHYWSLSLTWTNRGPFSKVVSQVAVIGVSGTAGLWAWLRLHEKSVRTQARLHHTWESLITRSHCSTGGRLGVLFLIKAGLMRPARMGKPHPIAHIHSTASVASSTSDPMNHQQSS